MQCAPVKDRLAGLPILAMTVGVILTDQTRFQNISQAAGLGRISLFNAPSPDGNPEFATVTALLKAVGLRLAVVA